MHDKKLSPLLMQSTCSKTLEQYAEQIHLQLRSDEIIKQYDYSIRAALSMPSAPTMWAITNQRVIRVKNLKIKSWDLSSINYVPESVDHQDLTYFCTGFLALNIVSVNCDYDADQFLDVLLKEVNKYRPGRPFTKRGKTFNSGDALAFITFIACFFAFNYFQVTHVRTLQQQNPSRSEFEIRESWDFKNFVFGRTAMVGGIVFCVAAVGLSLKRKK